MISFSFKIVCRLDPQSGALSTELRLEPGDEQKLEELPSKGLVEAAEACLLQGLRLLSLVELNQALQRTLRVGPEELGEKVQGNTLRMISALVPGVIRGVLEETHHGNTGNVS